MTMLPRNLARHGALLLLALLVAGCGANPQPPSAAAPTVAAPVPLAAPADRLYIHNGLKGGAERLTVVDGASGARQRDLPPGVVASDWSTLYVVAHDAATTRVQALEIASGRVLREASLGGAWSLPMVTPDSVLGGLSPDDRWLALVADPPQTDSQKTRFAILDTAFKAAPRTVELAGLFHFDGLSNGASALFLTESLTADPRGKYQVRRYDLAQGALDPNVIVAKGESQIMNGVRQTALTSRDGAWLYSLYLNPDSGPFIHALYMRDPIAFCLDLPKSAKADLARQARWSLILSGDGRTLYAVNGAIGQVVEIDVAGDVPAIKRSSTLFEAPAQSSSANPARPASTATALAPDGATLYTLADAGLLVIDAKSLALRGHYLADWSLDGMALSPDGARLYAVSAAAGKIVRLDPRAGTIVGEVPSQGRPTGVVRVES
jgi:hypothetical protein